MTVPLAGRRDEIEQEICRARRIWLGLDFDGTLAAIADHPGQVEVPNQSRSLLRTLAGQARMSVAIISGRELIDVREKVNLDSIAYSGNHGLEIEGPNLRYENQAAVAMQGTLVAIGNEVGKRLQHVPHVLIENKRLSLSVHYRRVASAAWPLVQEVVEAVVQKQPSFQVTCGKMVWEVKPSVLGSKGTAALWLKERQAGPYALPIFIGDDVTDEDAFRAFPLGLTVLVGDTRLSAAKYSVADHQEVHEFLNWLGAIVLTEGSSDLRGLQR